MVLLSSKNQYECTVFTSHCFSGPNSAVSVVYNGIVEFRNLHVGENIGNEFQS